MSTERSAASPVPPRRALDLTDGECWRLLRSVSVGRVVFTRHALPAIRPVNHVVEDRKIIIRTSNGAAIAAQAHADEHLPHMPRARPRGSVVCYEADQFDERRRTGWSVIATGLARLVTDPDDVARYRDAAEPWIGGDTDQVVAIEPEFISGRRLAG